MSSLVTGRPAEERDLKMEWDYAEANAKMLNPELDFVLQKLPFLRHLPGKPGEIYRNGVRAIDILSPSR